MAKVVQGRVVLNEHLAEFIRYVDDVVIDSGVFSDGLNPDTWCD